MKGDFTRLTFNREKQYNSVRLQQGRVQLDADWNEQVDVQHYLARTQSTDVIGACGVPRKNGGFEIIPYHNGNNGEGEEEGILHNDFKISTGRIYVNGILSENIGDSDSSDSTPYSGQHFYPSAPNLIDYAPGVYIVYLDVWERHITAIEDSEIRETALDGPDTATRMQTVWQVKLFSLEDEEKKPTNCWDIPKSWTNYIKRPKGEMRARAETNDNEDRPCIVAAAAGYRRLENQLYRVEIHEPGNINTATFKWSRDNGIVATRLLDVDTENKLLTVANTGKDGVLNFDAGQWVEINDDEGVLHNRPGIMVRLARVDNNTLVIEEWPEGIDTPDYDTAIVRRWDHKGTIGNAVKQGALPLAAALNEEWLELEDGVEVSFNLEEGAQFNTGDYWLVPARVVGGKIEWPVDELDNAQFLPPLGIQHHYCRLALVNWEGSRVKNIHDCRPFFPALTEPDLYYVSGDGQEAMPGDHLPQLLRVGVSNCNRPIEGAWVKFEIFKEGQGGNGALEWEAGAVVAKSDPGAAKKWFIVATDEDGQAACKWTLRSNVKAEDPELPPQQVRVTLLRDFNDPEDKKLDRPLMFSAGFGVAWEDKYGGTCFPDKTNPNPNKAVLTVEDMLDQLRENIAMYYVSGDGQEVARAPLNSGHEGGRLAKLPNPLVVRVANGDWPFAGATVKFSILDEKRGRLLEPGNAGNIGFSIDVKTDADGTARCDWELDSDVDAPWSQHVRAELIAIDPCDDSNKPWPYKDRSKLQFNANLSIASEVSYDGSVFPDKQHPKLIVENAEDALDQIRENITLYYVGGDGQESIPGKNIPQPLQVRVANNGWPLASALVRFKITSKSGGRIRPRTDDGSNVISDEEFTVFTNNSGLAECDWRLSVDGKSQQVTATLESVGGKSVPSQDYIRFNANTSTASQVYYDPTATEDRWADINGDGHSPTNNPPGTVQDAIDNIVNNMESSDIGYSVPSCPLPGDPAKTEGVPLFRELLGASGSTNLKALWDKLLCNMDAATVPYVPNNKLERWEDILDSGGNSNHVWSRHFGGTGDEQGQGIASDEFGNTILVGNFTSEIDIEGTRFVSKERFDGFVTKLGPQGEHIWSLHIEGNNVGAHRVAVDKEGNITVIGYFSGSANFSGQIVTSTTNRDAFIVKFTPEGEFQWLRHFGSSNGLVAQDVGVDGVGNVYVAGNFGGTIELAGSQLTSRGGNDAFVAKLSLDGKPLWAHAFGGDDLDLGMSIAVDDRGHAVVTGYFTGKAVVGDIELISSDNESDVFLVRLGPEGEYLWAQSIGGVRPDIGHDVSLDHQGNILLAGYFIEKLNIGGETLSGKGGWDAFVAKLDRDGKPIWSHAFGSSKTEIGVSVVSDRENNVLFSGHFSGTASLDGEPITSSGGWDLFVIKLGPEGDFIESQPLGGAGSEFVTSTTVDVEGNVLATGYFSGTANFGGDDFTSSGSDLFVVKLGQEKASLPVTVQSAIDSLIDNLESSDIRYQDRNVKDVLDELTHLAGNVALPSGTVIAHSASTPPTGWLECNGQAISRSAYPRLFSTIGITYGAGDGANTFNVPDLRGEFIRGWDGSRGVDKGRALGTFQLDQMQSHSHSDTGHVHTGRAVTGGAHSHTLSNIVKDTGGKYGTPVQGGFGLGLTWPGYNGTPHPTTGGGRHSHSLDVGLASTDLGDPSISTGGNPRHGIETRPRNIALMYCIKE